VITNPSLWEAWETEFARRTPVDFAHNLTLMEALREHAVLLGLWCVRAPLDGLESRIELARILNVRRTLGETGAGV